MKAIINQSVNADLRSNMTTLVPFDAPMTLTPIMEPFVATDDLDLATLVPATFTGSAAKTSGSPDVYYDSVLDRECIRLPDPLGGWAWQPTNGVNLPQTIYGFLVIDDAADRMASFNIAPVLLSSVLDAVILGSVEFTMAPDIING